MNRLTLSGASVGVSVVESLCSGTSLAAGVYDGGLFFLFEKTLERRLNRQWAWLVGEDAEIFAATAFGDLMFWSHRHEGVYYLEPQVGRSTLIEATVFNTLTQYLPDQEAREVTLRGPLVKEIVQKLGTPSYGTCFISKPWEIYGGERSASDYFAGDIEVYASMTAQAVKQIMDKKIKELR